MTVAVTAWVCVILGALMIAIHFFCLRPRRRRTAVAAAPDDSENKDDKNGQSVGVEDNADGENTTTPAGSPTEDTALQVHDTSREEGSEQELTTPSDAMVDESAGEKEDSEQEVE